jgi:transcriptional regulator with XRE-family HTH domain
MPSLNTMAIKELGAVATNNLVIRSGAARGTPGGMQGIGERLRSRAKVLGMTDTEVARRLGLSQGRYSNYVNEVVEPDLGTLVRIARALGVTADELLGMTPPIAEDNGQVLRTRIALAAEAMDPAALAAAALMFEAAAKSLRPRAAPRARRIKDVA